MVKYQPVSGLRPEGHSQGCTSVALVWLLAPPRASRDPGPVTGRGARTGTQGGLGTRAPSPRPRHTREKPGSRSCENICIPVSPLFCVTQVAGSRVCLVIHLEVQGEEECQAVWWWSGLPLSHPN